MRRTQSCVHVVTRNVKCGSSPTPVHTPRYMSAFTIASVVNLFVGAHCWSLYLQISLLFDNNGTVFFAMFMAVWGEFCVSNSFTYSQLKL